ncbi:sugar transferase [Catellatospora chokoriensis]|uniref:Polyprenyl glycosylphosphotransferase n=2 Tax=Catellatospora chokoriensis TaxID=310353 RepID=A0A8J3JRI1_9ACTN|nr:polyprenyl glycosylphosphotransferase [Catellatospora chokoriensis]
MTDTQTMTDTHRITAIRHEDDDSGVTAVLSRIAADNQAGFARVNWETGYVRLAVLGDALVAAVAAVLAIYFRFGQTWDSPWNRNHLAIALLFPVGWVVMALLTGAYDSRCMFLGNDEYARILRAALWLTAIMAFASYMLNLNISRAYPLISIPMVVTLTLAHRYLLRRVLHRRWENGRLLRRIIVAGHEQAVWELTAQLRRERRHGMQVVGVCLPTESKLAKTMLGGAHGHPKVYGSLDVDEVANAVAASGSDTIIVLPCPEFGSSAVRRLAWKLERDEIDVILASALIDVTGDRTTIRPVVGLPLLHLEHAKLKGGSRLLKAAVDFCGGLLGTLVLLPFLAVLGLLIKLTPGGRGPVIFRQTRVGRNGVPFTLYKFRTMHVDAESRLQSLRAHNDHDGSLFKMREDPRITPIGRWLRKYSLDELPQLINVLKGEMSLVGPRPPLPREVAEYGFEMRRRLLVKPGLTGLWQVSGRSDLPWAEAVRLDVHYVENWSLWMDLLILVRTAGAVLKGTGAY